ncbi:hypothetical protein WJX74_000867 [Apatococcus lobatus]|uniref:Ubiquitin-like domain-containing protein n=1 Tax=Apatococcus lobatus TaxID=904363 RepID=A0AAW1RRZ9_9CHLO
MASPAAPSEAEVSSQAEQINVKVKTMQPQTYGPLAVTPRTTVSEFKLRLQEETHIPVERQRLIFRGRALLDNQRLMEQHVEDGHTLHLVERPVNQAQPSGPQTSPGPQQPHAHAAGHSPTGQQPGAQEGPQVTWGQITIENHGVGPADFQQFMNGMLGGLGAAGLQGPAGVPVGIQINAETLLPGGAQGAGNPHAAGQHQGLGAQRPHQGVPPSHLLTSIHNHLNYTARATEHPFAPPRPVMAPIAPGRRHEVDLRAMQAARDVLDGAQLPDHVRRSIESAFGHANITRSQFASSQTARSSAAGHGSAGSSLDPPMGFPANSGGAAAPDDPPDPPRRRRGTVDGNPGAPITASVALGHLISIAETQLRDTMLPAMHAAGEALRNFTGLIDDADQRTLFRQRDPGADAFYGMQSASRPQPAPNSAADAPTQVREQVAAAYSNMAQLLPAILELMNGLGLHYWAMRGLPAPFLAAITTAINPYVGIGELRAATGEAGQAAGPSQPPAQPPLHPWTAAALPAGVPAHIPPPHLLGPRAQQYVVGFGPNGGQQQPFDILVFADAAAADAQDAAAAAGAGLARAAAIADGPRASQAIRGGLNADGTPRDSSHRRGARGQASSSAQDQGPPQATRTGPSAAGLPPLGVGSQSRVPGQAPAGRARQASDRPDERVIQQLGLQQDPATGRWVLNAPELTPGGAAAPAARNPFLPSNFQPFPVVPRTLQEDATQWINLITNSHRLYTSTRQHNTHELNRLLRQSEANYFGSGPPPTEVTQALRGYLAELSRVPTPTLPAVPHFFSPPDATPANAFPATPPHQAAVQDMPGSFVPTPLAPGGQMLGTLSGVPGNMHVPPAAQNAARLIPTAGLPLQPSPAVAQNIAAVQQQFQAQRQPATTHLNSLAAQQQSGADSINPSAAGQAAQPTAPSDDAQRSEQYQRWIARTQAGLSLAGDQPGRVQATGRPTVGARDAPQPNGTTHSAAQPSTSAEPSSQTQPAPDSSQQPQPLGQSRPTVSPQQAHRQTQTRVLPGTAGLAQMMQMLQTGGGGVPAIAQGMQPLAMGMGPTVFRLGGVNGPAITLVPATPPADQPNQAPQLGSVNIGGANGLTLRPDGPARMRAEVAGHQLTVQLDMQPLISALNGAFNQIYTSGTVAGATTAQGPPERPQEGIAAAAGALMGQLARQLVPEAIISMTPGMTPADMAPRAAPNGPAAPAPRMDQGELDEVQVRIEPNEGSPESVQAIAPVLQALAGSLGLPANAFSGMLESIAGQPNAPAGAPNQEQGSPSQPGGAAAQPNGNAPQAAGAPTQAGSTPPTPTGSSAAAPAASSNPTQGTAAPTGSAAAPAPPTPAAPPSPLGATWQALLQALGSDPPPNAPHAHGSATNATPTQPSGPIAQSTANSPTPHVSQLGNLHQDQPEGQKPSSRPDNDSPSEQLPSSPLSEGSPSAGPSQGPTLASVKTEEIPSPADESGTASPASSAAGFTGGDLSAPGMPAPVVAGGLGSAGVQRAAEAAVYQGMRRAMVAQGIDIPADVDENTVRRAAGEDEPFASLLSHPIAVPQTPDGSLPSSPQVQRFPTGEPQSVGTRALQSNGPTASRLHTGSPPVMPSIQESHERSPQDDGQQGEDAAGRPGSSGSRRQSSAGKGLGGLGLPSRKGKAPVRKPAAPLSSPNQVPPASTPQVPPASSTQAPQAAPVGPTATPRPKDSGSEASQAPPPASPAASPHSDSAGFEQVDAQPPPRQPAATATDGGLAGIMGQLLQGLASPQGSAGRGNEAASLGGALDELLQGAGIPAGLAGTPGPQTRPTSDHHHHQQQQQQQQSSRLSSRGDGTGVGQSTSGVPAGGGIEAGGLGGALGQLLQGLGSSASGPAGPTGFGTRTPSSQQPQASSTSQNAGSAQPAPGMPAQSQADAGGLGPALGQLLQGLGNTPGGAGSTGSQGVAGGASGGGLGAMMGQMLRNPQLQQMALGMASQLEGQFGSAAQQPSEAGSTRAQPALDLGGIMGMVNQMLVGSGGSAQPPTGVGASPRTVPQGSQQTAPAEGSLQSRPPGSTTPSVQRNAAQELSVNPPAARLLEEALSDYPPEDAAHWRRILQQDAARAGTAASSAPRSAVYQAGSRHNTAAGSSSNLESLFN